MHQHHLAACELKPLHPEKLRATLTRALSAAHPVASEAKHVAATATVKPVATILVAEDNPVNQKVTLLQLRNLGYTADVVADGSEAIAALRRRPYSLVLMDAQMPTIDGIEATRRIRAAEHAGEPGFSRRVPIVAMTANAMSGDREACLAAGMDDYLAKPVKPDSLREVLTRFLSPEPSGDEAEPALALVK
jgi:CheY-like chemotaxis protein